MGTVELDNTKGSCLITANMITYGNAADPVVTKRIRKEIEEMWNEPAVIVTINNLQLRVQFKITAALKPSITPDEIFADVDPRNNFFRIEEFVHGNISFVDGLNSNSGYFLLENLYEGSTTAAHEFGHTLGLD
ncbi:MAG: peptidase M10, partial [Flavisolibacter sp.]|nr:peptidase M10 [Flavisolibacter sp.]